MAAQFSYRAKQGPDKIVQGTIEADRMEDAVAKVMQRGLSPIDVQPVSENRPEPAAEKFKLNLSGAGSFFAKRISPAQLSLFMRQMADLVEASVPLLKALDLVGKQTRHPYLQGVIQQMYDFVKDGGSLSAALRQHPKVFPAMYANMVKAGEISGQLNIVLNRLAHLVEQDQETQNRVKASLAYPAFILAVGFLTVFVLLSFVMPRLTVIFDDMDQELPMPTQVIMGLSGFFAEYWWAVMLLAGGAVYYWQRWLQTPHGRLWWDTACLKIPVLGNFITEVEVGRFARTLGTLLESGVVIVEALQSVWAVVDNVVLKEEIKRISQDVTDGSSLTAGLKSSPFFPETVVNMVSVGEETGNMEKGLFKLADAYERQSELTAKTVLSLFGPMVLVVIVGIVGFCVVSMLLPIFRMNMIIQ